MRILDEFVCDNGRIEILSGNGRPSVFPEKWGPVLGNSDMVVAIPDMHMFLFQSNLDNFKYGAESMLHFLTYLGKLQREMYFEGRTLRVVQLGDLYELRFSVSPSTPSVTRRDIFLSHPLYEAVLRSLASLDPVLIYGNHDYEHRSHNRFCENFTDGSVYFEHGFNADRWYHFSNPRRPLWSPMMSVFRMIRSAEAALAELRRSLFGLPSDRHVAIGVMSGQCEVSHYPDERKYPRRILDFYRKHLGKLSAAHKVPRVWVVAHSHRPYLDPEFADGQVVFIDAGAWTDGRSDFAFITNSEAAVCRYRRTAAVETAIPYRTAV